MTDHLDVVQTDRGFKHLPPIPSRYGGEVLVYESSSAERPCLWLKVKCPTDLNEPEGEQVEAFAHLTVEDAWRLADQLRWLVENHYHGEVAIGRVLGAGLSDDD